MEASNDPPGPGNTEPEESSAKPIHVSYYMNNGVLSVREKDLKDVYELKEEISRGDFGPVFKVVQRTTGQAAEAKFKQLPRFVRRQEALREIEMLFLFTPHPNLLLLHDAFQMLDSKEIVLITEPLQGCSLFEWLVSSRGRVTERVCAGYLRKLCSALNHLHAASIMHLDLKPESLQLACGDELKLTGFSVARRCGEEPSLLRGDAEFSAPEQLGSEAATINTDMWPVGLLAIIVLSGVSPFWASTKEEMVQKVISATWAFPDSFSSISKGAKDFISKLVKKSPETRMSAALCLEHAWLDGTAADKPLSTATLKEFWGRYKSEKPASYVHCFPKSAKAKQSEEKE